MAKSATFSTDGTNATLVFTWTTTKDIAQRVADNAAHYLFDLGQGDHGEDGLRPYSDLTNQEKIDILLGQATQSQRGYAYSWEANDAQQTAKDEIPPYDDWN